MADFNFAEHEHDTIVMSVPSLPTVPGKYTATVRVLPRPLSSPKTSARSSAPRSSVDGSRMTSRVASARSSIEGGASVYSLRAAAEVVAGSSASEPGAASLSSSSSVRLPGSARVSAPESARVSAPGSARVSAPGSARVSAPGSVRGGSSSGSARGGSASGSARGAVSEQHTGRPDIVARTEAKKVKEKEALEAAAIAAIAASGGAGGAEARRAAMAAAAAAIERMKVTNKGPRMSEAPHAIRNVLEAARYKGNGELHRLISFEHRVEERRLRLEALCGSNAERERMMSVHSASREETRRELLRASIRREHEMLQEIKKAGVKSFAGFADAFG